MTHITYKTAKMLKEFLGESAPRPMMCEYWVKDGGKIMRDIFNVAPVGSPAYQLHDLLSKPFCEAMGKKMKWDSLEEAMYVVNQNINNCFYKGGLPAVEKVLIEMMEGK